MSLNLNKFLRYNQLEYVLFLQLFEIHLWGWSLSAYIYFFSTSTNYWWNF